MWLLTLQGELLNLQHVMSVHCAQQTDGRWGLYARAVPPTKGTVSTVETEVFTLVDGLASEERAREVIESLASRLEAARVSNLLEPHERYD